jgi:hypothetical protein
MNRNNQADTRYMFLILYGNLHHNFLDILYHNVDRNILIHNHFDTFLSSGHIGDSYN